MLWFIFSLFTAIFESTKDAFSKSGLKSIDEYIAAWGLHFFALPFLLSFLFFIEMPVFGNQFLPALIIGGLLNVAATILYMKAIKLSDLSLTMPMITFTPMFLLITPPLLIGEFPGIFGVIGIFLIIIGSYMLNIKKKFQGYLGPFRALFKEKGPRLMLVVAFIWSITSNFDKIGLLNSSPILWVISINLFATLCMFPIMLYKSGKRIRQIPANLNILVPIGFFSSLALIFQMTAISVALVVYVISIKRLSAVISVIFGCLIFREKSIKERLLGAVIMILGVLFIALLS